MCSLKCAAEFDDFDAEILRHSNAALRQTTVISKQQESRFFQDLDEDAYTPMHILAMVELSDCRPICGGLAVDEQKERDGNKDTCIAIAGEQSKHVII